MSIRQLEVWLQLVPIAGIVIDEKCFYFSYATYHSICQSPTISFIQHFISHSDIVRIILFTKYSC